MKTHLPLLVERTVTQAKAASQELASSFFAQLQSQLSDEGITCTKGCHNCCYHPVLLSLLEGVALYRWLSEQRLWTTALKETFKAHADRTRNLSFEVWLLSMIPCPLLTKDGLCGAYEARPFSCQITYSVGDPEQCHPHQIGDNTRIVPKREVLERLANVEVPLLKRHGLNHFRIPMAEAVLYGERIAKGELDLEDSAKTLWVNLIEASNG